MSAQIAIGDYVIELDQQIKYNFQIADVGDISVNKSNYTSSFQVPKTAENVRIFEGLGIPSDTSTVPYRINDVKCMDNYTVVYTGTMVVLKTDHLYYHVTVISGVYDFASILGDTRFSDINIMELIHAKTLDTVPPLVFNLDGPLAYYVGLFADSVEGQYWNSGLNIDVMAPAVRLSYLLDKVFEYANLNYTLPSTTIADMEDEFLTFPYPPYLEVGSDDQLRMEAQKGNTPGIVVPSTQAFNSDVALAQYGDFDFVGGLGFYSTAPLTINFDRGGQFIVVFEDFLAFQHPLNEVGGDPITVQLFRNDSTYPIGQFQTRTPNDSPGEVYRTVHSFRIGDRLRIQFIGGPVGGGRPQVLKIDNINLKFYDTIVTSEGVDQIFGLTLSSFIKDFMWRYALVPIQSPDGITFIEYSSIFDAEAIDWSDKYIQRTEESYDIGYAQNNYLRHKYFNDDSSYYDKLITSNNLNLSNSKTIVQSNFFAPSFEDYTIHTRIIGGEGFYAVTSKKYETYEVTLKDDQGERTADIKTQNRNFFVKLRQVLWNANEISLQSSTLPGGMVHQVSNINTSERNHSSDIGFSAAFSANSRWDVLDKVVNNTRLHIIELRLTETDINSLDLTRPYYFQQESAYYIMNKLQFEKGSPARGEFIKINNYG